MLCQQTDGRMEAVHVDTGALKLAIELTPYIAIIEEHGQGNGDIIVPIRSNAVSSIRVTLGGKLRKIIQLIHRER